MVRPALKKRFGQHHLRSAASCRPLLDFLRPEGHLALEIGPGGGVLTRELATSGARVWALELDLEWAVHLKRNVGAAGSRIEVVLADAVGFPWSRLPAPALITGNLPFNVGTRLVDDTLEAACLEPERLPRLAFMVQKEVAERLVARPGGKAYGALSVLVQCRARPSYLGTVPARAFRPPPKVDAGFVGFRPQAPACGAERLRDFRALVHSAFSSRRKMLRGLLAKRWGRERVEAALEHVGIPPTARAEELDANDFVRLLRALD